MGLASIRNRVKRIERTLRVPVTATDAAARAKMVSLLTLLANDDWAWSEWIASGGGSASGGADDVARFVPLAQRVNAAMTTEPAAGGAERGALRHS